MSFRVCWQVAKGDLRLEIGLRLGDLLLRTGHPARARTVFQQLLVEEVSRDGAARQLRQRIVLSYFDEGRFSEAATFAKHLTAESAPEQPSWRLLRALIALSLDRPEEAVTLLHDETSIEAETLANFRPLAEPDRCPRRQRWLKSVS